MIDSKLKLEIERRARQCLEEIHSDLVACGPAYAEDAVEPTVWQMSFSDSSRTGDLEKTVQVMAKKYDHPDRKEFLSIVESAIKGYF